LSFKIIFSILKLLILWLSIQRKKQGKRKKRKENFFEFIEVYFWFVTREKRWRILRRASPSTIFSLN